MIPSWIPSSLPSHLRTSQHRNSIPSSAHSPTNRPSRQRQSVASEHSFLCLAEKHKRPLRRFARCSPRAPVRLSQPVPQVSPPSVSIRVRRAHQTTGVVDLLRVSRRSVHFSTVVSIRACAGRVRGRRPRLFDGGSMINERVCSLKRVDPATTASRSTDRDLKTGF